MTSSGDAVTVIIPTLALRERAELLERSIESVLTQQGVRATPLVVVNGSEQDGRIVDALRHDTRIRMVVTAKADLPGALRLGRSHVDTSWFAALDDDDVLLPGALLARTLALEERSDCVAVVTNGFRRDGSGDTLHRPGLAEVRSDPLRSMLKFNWLLPGSWLGRTAAFDDEVFQRMPRYLECTYLGIRLATTHRTCFLDAPTIAWSADSPRSVSKSREYQLGAAAALCRILELDLPVDVRHGFRKKLADARHTAAQLYLKEGDRRAAWQSHLRSLCGPASWRFLRLTPRFFLTTKSRVPTS
jgi:glycosyltransferase involved in cell wall biosynthesis